jgi:hypothetical protein
MRDLSVRAGLELLLIGLVMLVLALAGASPASAQSLPADVQATCTVSTQVVPPASDAAVFASWFHSGTVTANGVVDPANSVKFINQPNCSFYEWAERMFMFLTSPSGSGRILDSPVFFDVSPENSKGHRTFISHVAGKTLRFSMRAAQAGAHGLPVIFDKAGRMLEVQPSQMAPSGKPLILNKAGQAVEIERATLENGVPLFLDVAGKPIEGARPVPQAQLQSKLTVEESPTSNIVQQFMIGQTPVYMTLSGKLIDVEQGQAEGGVLEAQNGSLVYYATMVNDVYAYFASREKSQHLNDPFPTKKAELDKIVAFAAAHGKTFSDPNALAIEVKSSWVEAAGLPHLNSYITMTATIPDYDKSDPNEWKLHGQKTVKLALVGIHVVGSTAGHPEMIWATFEHTNNTPIAEYKYNSTSGLKTIHQDTSGPWLFSSNNPSFFNVEHMVVSGHDIVPQAPHSISPSDTIRWKTWGAASNLSPNPADLSGAASNTEILSINNNVRGMMKTGDIRSNYIMTGATWTIDGDSPIPTFSNPQPSDPPTAPGAQVGTSQLANTTMETYQQGKDTTTTHGGSNCFSCHVSNTTRVSHVYGPLLPLAFPKPPPNPTEVCIEGCQKTDQQCVDGCDKSRDLCMQNVAKPGGPRPQECIGELRTCTGLCSADLLKCTGRCK